MRPNITTIPDFDVPQREPATVAGVAIIIKVLAAMLSTDVVPGDVATAFSNIKASELLFRVGIFSWAVILVCDVLAAWGLYIYLRPINQSLSSLMA